MTAYDILVPLIALSIGGGIALYVRWSGKRFDAKYARSERAHPGE